jgi:hypothetical protein
MGLKQDLIDAKIEALKLSGATDDTISEAQSTGSPLEVQSEMEKEAIAKFLTEVEFRITQIKAPVILESLQTPEQSVNVKLDTLLGEYQPILKALKQIAEPVGLGATISALEGEIEKAITPLLEGGAILPGLDLGKDDGGLQATGYVFIGEDPESQGGFDVEDEDGQKEFTTVKLIRDDIEDLL